MPMSGSGKTPTFKTIDVPAGTDPVADSCADTLTHTSSDNFLTITGTAGTDTIDWTVGSGASGLIDHGGLMGLSDDDHTQYLLLAGRSGGQSAQGGTVTGDHLVLSAAGQVPAPSESGRIQIESLVEFTRPNDTDSTNFILIKYAQTIDDTGSAVAAAQGFGFTPTIQYDTAAVINVSTAFTGSPRFDEVATVSGSHNSFSILGFLAEPQGRIDHNGTGTNIPNLYGYDADPITKRGPNSTTGTMTIDNMGGFTTNPPNALRAFFGAQQVQDGMTVTSYHHFIGQSGGNLLFTGTGSITTEYGFRLNGAHKGTQGYSFYADDTSWEMVHGGRASFGHANDPDFPLDVAANIRIRPAAGLSTLRFSGTGASDDTVQIQGTDFFPGVLVFMSVNNTNNESMNFDLETVADQVKWNVVGTAKAQVFQTDSSGGQIIIGDDDQRLIGVTTGKFTLNVEDTSSTFVWQINRASTGGLGARYGFFTSRGTISSPAIIQDGDTVFSFEGFAYDGTAHFRAGNIRLGIVSGSVPAANTLSTNYTLSTEHPSDGPIRVMYSQGPGTDIAFTKFNSMTLTGTAGSDVDILMASTNDADLFYLDCANDRIGISTNAPDTMFHVAGAVHIDSDLELDGDLNHDGTNVGFYGTAPVAQSSAYTPSNVSTDRSYDANSTTVDELADVVGTLIADLQATGLIG